MIELFLAVLIVSGILVTLLGYITIFYIFVKDKKHPMDRTNRINHFRLWWFVLTKPEMFVEKFPWLKNDESDNFK